MTSRTLNIERDRLGEILDLIDGQISSDYLVECEYEYDAEPSRPPDLRGHPDTWVDGDPGYRDYRGVQGDPATDIAEALLDTIESNAFRGALRAWIDREARRDLDDASDDNLREDY